MAPNKNKGPVKKGTGRTANSAGNARRTTSGNHTASKPKARKGSSGSKNSGKSASASARFERNDPSAYEIRSEIYLLIMLVLVLLLFLSNFNLGGKIGSTVNGYMFGVFGLCGYLFPVFLFFFTAFILANRGNRALLPKIFYVVGMVMTFTAFVQLCTKYKVTERSAGEIRLTEYYTLAKQFKKGGGIVGGFLCWLFEPLFGRVGSFLVIIAMFLAFFMLFSRKALFAWIAKLSAQRYALHKVHADERRELYEQKQREREDLYETKRQEAMERRQARTYLLSEEDKAKAAGKKAEEEPKEKEPMRNFFGGVTPTGDYMYHADYKLPDSTVDEVNRLCDENTQKTNKRNNVKNNRPVEKNEQEEKLHALNISGNVAKDSEESPSVAKTQRTQTTGRDRGPTIAELLMRAEAGRERDRSSSGAAVFYDDVDASTAETQVPEKTTEFNKNVTSFQEEQKLPEETVDESRALKTAAFGNRDTRRTKTPTTNSAENKSSETPESITVEEQIPVKEYEFPSTELLTKPKAAKGISEKTLMETAAKLQSTLDSFGVRVTVNNVSCGPSVTRYELLPEQGVKVSRITSLADDIKLNLAASDVRIEAPIPGKAAVGIEVPNKENSTVFLRELLESEEFKAHPSRLAFAVGKDIGGQTVVTDIAKMPHLLIAGATGSGKSVCINTLIMSLIYKSDPKDVKLIMVDPKVVELSVYNGIPHLLIPVVTDPKKASAALNWAVMEMTERYQKFAELGVRDLKGYNERVEDAAKEGLEEEKYKRLPQIVIIVDELADLMMVAPGEVEDSICRLAQLARAAGLHLVIATQRPSVNVITGLIKANIPSRIAFAVSSAIDSRTILDGSGAEKLLGKGDMLYYPQSAAKPIRGQGAFVSDKEVEDIVGYIKKNNDVQYDEETAEAIVNSSKSGSSSVAGGTDDDGEDELFYDAVLL